MNIHHVKVKDQVLTESVNHLEEYVRILELEIERTRRLIANLAACLSDPMGHTMEATMADHALADLIKGLHGSGDGSASSPSSEDPSHDKG